MMDGRNAERVESTPMDIVSLKSSDIILIALSISVFYIFIKRIWLYCASRGEGIEDVKES